MSIPTSHPPYFILLPPFLPANPAICPQVDYVEALVHHQAELAVFISTLSGPLPQNRVTWYWPNGEQVLDTDPRVMFQTTGRRLILSGLMANDSGSYRCQAIHVAESITSNSNTTIQLEVFGKCVL